MRFRWGVGQVSKDSGARDAECFGDMGGPFAFGESSDCGGDLVASITTGRLLTRPWASAAARPAMVRSCSMSRSSSANAAVAISPDLHACHSPTLGPEVVFATVSGPADLWTSIPDRFSAACRGVGWAGPEPIVTGPLPASGQTRVRKSPSSNISSSVSTGQGFRTAQAGALTR